MWGATIKQIKKKKKSTQNILVFEAAEEQTQSVRLCQSNMKAPSVLQSKNRQKKEPIVFACFNRQDSSRKWPTDLVVSESAFPKTYVQARDRQLDQWQDGDGCTSSTSFCTQLWMEDELRSGDYSKLQKW